jgi:hypothetical protein
MSALDWVWLHVPDGPVRRRLIGALAEQSTYTGLQGAALFVGLSESRYTAVAGLLVFVFGLAKIMLPDAGSAR